MVCAWLLSCFAIVGRADVLMIDFNSTTQDGGPHNQAGFQPYDAGHEMAMHAVERALERCDVCHLADRWVETLSGGEWQRVRIARALAQEPRALALDEATANLDIRHEMELFELTSQLVSEGRFAGVLVTHQVNLAARFADQLVVMDQGTACAIGRPNEVLTRDVLERVFDWPVTMTDWRGWPQFIPLRKDEFEP